MNSQPYNSGGHQPPGGPPPPSPYRLRPLTLADVLDITFSLIKRNWRAIGIVVVLFSAPIAVIDASSALVINLTSESSLFDTTGDADTTALFASLGAVLVLLLAVFLVWFIVQPLVIGTIARIVGASYLGRQLTAGEGVRGVLRLWPSLLGTSILTGLAQLAAVLPFVALGIGLVFALGVVGYFIAAALVLLAIPPFVAIAVLFFAAPAVVAIEEVKAVPALRRSWALMRSRFWPYLGTLILVVLVTWVVAFTVAIIPSLISAVLVGVNLEFLAWPFDVISSLLSNLVSLPITAVVATLLYFDARVRREGFDVQMMAAQLPGSGGAPPAYQPQQPPPPPPPAGAAPPPPPPPPPPNWG